MTKAVAIFLIAFLLVGCCSAADPDFTLVFVPDPQYLTLCPIGYSALLQWVVNNQATVVDGSALNIKAVVGLGDIVNTPANGPEQSNASAAWAVLDAGGMPWITPPGNHDLTQVTPSRIAGAHFSGVGGAFNPATRASAAVWGQSLPGGGGTAFWGGYLDEQDYYIRLVVGQRKLLIIALTFYPGTTALAWAKGIHDMFPDHETIVTTHAYLDGTGAQSTRGVTFGPDYYSMGASPYSNSGTEMWTNSFQSWKNLSIIFGGHFIGPTWWWQRTGVASTSTRGQTVQQLYTDLQDLENTIALGPTNPSNTTCFGGIPDGTSDIMNLFLLKFVSATNTLRGYEISVNSGKWWGASGPTVASPVRLFDVADGIPEVLSLLFPMPPIF